MFHGVKGNWLFNTNVNSFAESLKFKGGRSRIRDRWDDDGDVKFFHLRIVWVQLCNSFNCDKYYTQCL